MKARIVVGLVIAALLAPAISQAADPVDEQFQSLAMPGANSLGFQANESNFAKTEVSTWFNFTTSDGTASGTPTKITICNINPFTTKYAFEFLKQINEEVAPNSNVFNDEQMNHLDLLTKLDIIEKIKIKASCSDFGRNL